MKITHYRDRHPNGQYAKDALRSKGQKLTKGQRRANEWRNLMWLVFIAELIYLGCVYTDKVLAQELPSIQPTLSPVAQEIPPIMVKITDCESGLRLPNGNAMKGSATHYDKSGIVKLRSNKNRSVDIGIMQINNFAWSEKARELHLDLLDENDNIKMGLWIYEHKGTQPWYSSAKCWKS